MTMIQNKQPPAEDFQSRLLVAGAGGGANVTGLEAGFVNFGGGGAIAFFGVIGRLDGKGSRPPKR